MIDIQQITPYLDQNTRNKILFCKEDIHEVKFVDVGYNLSLLISQQKEESGWYDAINNLLAEHVSINATIGSYLALENIDILFEPELKFDFRSMLDSFSKNQILIIKSESVIQDNHFFFLRSEDDIMVNLQGLSYNCI